MAAYAGWKPSRPLNEDVLEGDDLANFLAMFPGAVAKPPPIES